MSIMKQLMQENEIKDTIVYVNGSFVKKSEAVISVYDSGFQHGDGAYEGIRIYANRVFMLDEHIKRLYESCYALDIPIGMPSEDMKELVKELARRNRDAGVVDMHMRLQVTRGLKLQTGMHPNLNRHGSSIVICVDEKKPIFPASGIVLASVWIRRYSPDYLDPKIHSCNQLNQIMAAEIALRQGADEAIMFDRDGYVAETNSTNLQMIKDGVLILPTIDAQLPGITRKMVIAIARKERMPIVERKISLSEFYNADEAFICGTVGEIVPVREIDGRKIGKTIPGTITKRLQQAYRKTTKTLGTDIDENSQGAQDKQGEMKA